MNLVLLTDSDFYEKNGESRFFKFFYLDKLYIIDRMKINIVLKILKSQQEETSPYILDEAFLKKTNIIATDILELISVAHN